MSLFTTGSDNGECRNDGTDNHYLFFVLLDLDVIYNPFPVALIYLQVVVSPSVLALLLLVANHAHFVYI
jgi:NADH:ubiquinone oxidoreductase subunit 3 (subunit A)